MRSTDHILGVILAGGRSQRFGGGDKTLTEIAGEPILSRVIARFGPQVDQLILNANGDGQRFARYDIETIADSESPESGPLSGILAALDWAQQHVPKARVLATVSADVPFLPRDLVERLDAARNEGVAIAASGGRRHPTIALWPMSVRQSVADALARGARGVDRLASDLKAVAVSFPMGDSGGMEIDPFFNINTRDDLETARLLAERSKEG
jgi:molybdenum cofactor guanylyltransferase